jgi:hypothetical protein
MDNIKMPAPKAYPIDWGTGKELKRNIEISEQPDQVEEFDDENYEEATKDGETVYKHKASGALYLTSGQKLGGRRRIRKSSRRKSKRVKSYRMKGGRRKRSRRRR